MKRQQKARRWVEAELKKEQEGACRVCASHNIVTDGPLESSHVIGREHDRWREDLQAYWVDPDSVVPMCGLHHESYHARDLDLLPYLTLDEQLVAVDQANGIYSAYRKTCPATFARERV